MPFYDVRQPEETARLESFGCQDGAQQTVCSRRRPAPKLNKKTGRYTATVTLKNNDGATPGPISLFLDGLAFLTVSRSHSSCSATSP